MPSTAGSLFVSLKPITSRHAIPRNKRRGNHRASWLQRSAQNAKQCSLVGLLAFALVVSSAPIAKAQNATPRITESVDETKLVVLRGNTRPEANGQNDRGPVPDGFRMEHMFLQLRRSPEQERALDQLIDQLHDSKSPNFHHWLTTQEFGQKYGLAAEDLTTITGWLQSSGFAVNVVYPNGILIDFSGTAGQVRNAFHTEIHYLDVKGARHIANMRDQQVPAALAPTVVGVVSLNDFKPHPMFTISGPCNPLPTQPSNCYSVVPADLATIYGFNPLFAKGISGQGQTIVVLEDSDVFSRTDWTTFRSTFGLSSFMSGSFTQVNPAPPSGTNNCMDPGATSDDGEAILDAEWASAAAPSAAIVLASCSTTTLPGATFPTFGGLIALQNLINASTEPPAVMSISFGVCEAENTFPSNAAYSLAYQQAVSKGVSVFVAAGDEGAAGCDPNELSAINGIAVNGFASTQYNVAVGGTDFGDTVARTNTTYWNSTNTPRFGSALSYIPEIPWNDSCASTLIATFVSGLATTTTYGSNGFCNSTTGQSFFLNDSGGSGGPSSCATGSFIDGTCAGTSKPSWQQSFLGNPNDGVRDLPDVSLFAGDGVWGHAYVVCWSDPLFFGQGAAPCTGPPDTWSRFGGTSVATPIVAGIQALINQKTGSRWGNPNPTYYSLATAEYGASGNASCNSSLGTAVATTCIFYDVTQGDMDVPCFTNLTDMLINCYRPSGVVGVLSTSNSAYQPAFGTNTGWDFATGLGSVNATNLVNS
jgi:subtilase family serine protease